MDLAFKKTAPLVTKETLKWYALKNPLRLCTTVLKTSGSYMEKKICEYHKHKHTAHILLNIQQTRPCHT